MRDVALVPQGDVVIGNLGVCLHDARKAAHALGSDGVALVRHGGRALLALLERLLSLDDVGLLHEANLHGDALKRGGRDGERRHDLGMTVAGKHLGRQRVGGEAELGTDILLHERVDGGVGAHCTRDGAGGCNLAGLLEASLGTLEGPCPGTKLHAEGHGLGMNAVRAAHAQGILELKGTAAARLAELLDIGQNDVDGLRDLIGKRGIAQIGARHAVVHPAGRLGVALGNLGVDVGTHVREEGDDVVVGDRLDLVDFLLVEGGMLGNPSRLFLGDADFAQLSLGFASRDLNLLPNGVLVLKLPDGSHFGAGVAIDHGHPLVSQA